MIVSTRVTYRDQSGKFMSLCNAAAIKSAEALAIQMGRDARRRAPSGPAREDYGRREKLKPSVHPVIITPKEWAVVAKAGHAGAIEEGAGAHFIPNAFGRGVPVLHPGNAAEPFLLPSIEAARRSWKRILSAYYPG